MSGSFFVTGTTKLKTTKNSLLRLSPFLLFIQYFAILFQVTTNPEARVGRFSVSRAQDQSLDSSQAHPPVAQAANGPSNLGQILSPDPAHKASLPSLNNSFSNSYISSDNDSEFEDEDFKREVSLLREKQVASSSLFSSSCCLFNSFVVKCRRKLDFAFVRLLPPCAQK